METFKVSAPGKLVLAGEWAILEPGNPGLIAAVNKRVWAQIEPTDKICVTIKDFGIENLKAEFDGKQFRWERELTEKEKVDTQFIKGAIETTLKYLQDLDVPLRWFKITSWGEEYQIVMDSQQKKIGFGSSAASVVATVAAILKFHGQEIESRQAREAIYKLATIAHYFIQGKLGSGFDVAASTFGGIFVYKRFSPDWLVKEVESRKDIKKIVDESWPGLYIEQLEIPKDFRLVVGWTKSSASTTNMIKQMDKFKTANPTEYKRIFDRIANLVKRLISAWKAQNKKEILNIVRQNESLLRQLTQKSGVPIETPELRKLAEVANAAGGAGKLAGAGGGDCGIAVCFDGRTQKRIVDNWLRAGLWPLDIGIVREGVR